MEVHNDLHKSSVVNAFYLLYSWTSFSLSFSHSPFFLFRYMYVEGGRFYIYMVFSEKSTGSGWLYFLWVIIWNIYMLGDIREILMSNVHHLVFIHLFLYWFIYSLPPCKIEIWKEMKKNKENKVGLWNYRILICKCIKIWREKSFEVFNS